MLIDTLLIPIASVFYYITKLKEKRLGYTLNFPQLSDDWINAKVIFQMDGVWKREGLDAIGTNYFTIGSVKRGKSSRFDSNSPYYQSWLGGYIVKFDKKREWRIEDHYRLGVADQKSWLRCYGKNDPNVEIDFDNIEDLGAIEIDKYNGKLYRGNIYSNTDVGSGKISFYHRLELSGLAYYFKQTNKSLKLISANLIPK